MFKEPFKKRARFVFSVVMPMAVLSACYPEAIPPGDIVSSITPLEAAPAASQTVLPRGTPVPYGNSVTVNRPMAQIGGDQSTANQPQQVAGLFSRVPLVASKPRSESICQRQLRKLGVRFDTPPAVDGPGGCGIAHPVKVNALSGGIQMVPAATINCPMALAFAKWVKYELAGAARRRYLSGIKSIHQMSAYSCRTMNSKRGAPLSEHAKGNALDIGKIRLNNGKDIVVKRPGLFAFRERGLLHQVRGESCKYFTTVLGPGSDVHHKDHFHFDLRQRQSGYRHCD